jgi:hypothetical protein
MKPFVAGALATLTALGLLSACGDDVKLTVPNNTEASTDASTDAGAADEISIPSEITLPPGLTLPDGVTLPEGVTIPAGALPSDVSIPTAVIDQMIAQFEAAGMKVNKECFSDLLKDESLRKMVEAGGSLNQDVIQRFISCLST